MIGAPADAGSPDVKEPEDNALQSADGASDRDETLAPRLLSEVTARVVVMSALILTCIAYLFFVLGWGTLTDVYPSRSTTSLGLLTLFLSLLGFRWRWARFAALVSAAATVACLATGA